MKKVFMACSGSCGGKSTNGGAKGGKGGKK